MLLRADGRGLGTGDGSWEVYKLSASQNHSPPAGDSSSNSEDLPRKSEDRPTPPQQLTQPGKIFTRARETPSVT